MCTALTRLCGCLQLYTFFCTACSASDTLSPRFLVSIFSRLVPVPFLSWALYTFLSWALYRFLSWALYRFLSWALYTFLSWALYTFLSWALYTFLSWALYTFLSWALYTFLSWALYMECSSPSSGTDALPLWTPSGRTL